MPPLKPQNEDRETISKLSNILAKFKGKFNFDNLSPTQAKQKIRDLLNIRAEGGMFSVLVVEIFDAIQKNIKFIKGDKGDRGLKGERGEKGKIGNDGSRGKKGDIGFRGLAGPQGSDGNKGDRGDFGVQGDPGSPDEAKDIIKKLLKLKGSNRLPASAIKDIPTVERQLSPISLFGGQKGGGSSTPMQILSYGDYINRAANKMNFIGGSVRRAGNDGVTVDFSRPNIDYIDFNLTASPEHQEGRMHWDDDAGTIEIGMPGGNVKLQVGQEILIRAKNETGSTITNGSPVYVSGASGNKPTVAPASATNHLVANATIAVATEDIDDGQFGYVNSFGLVRDIDTSMVSADGQPVFLSTTSGELSASLPTQPNSQVFIGVVLRKHATEGVLLVKIIPQPNLDELSNVLISSIAGDDVLTYDAINSRWKNTNTLELDRLTIRGDNVVNRISYPLSGLSAFQQTLNIVIDGANVYMETEAVGTGDMPYVFDEEKHVLDCTTGAGTNGKARVSLTVGTHDDPITNYIYVVPDGVGVATLTASTSLPTGTFAWHSIAVLQDVVTLASHGSINLQRMTEALKHDGRGQLSYIIEKLRWLGGKWLSGCAQVLSGTTTIDLTVASGMVFQLHRQTFPALAVVADGITVANADGGGVLGILENVHDLNDIAETTDGNPIGVNKYFSATVWATMASSDQNGNQSKLFINLPTGTYNSESAAIADSSNYDVRTAPTAYNNTAFLIGRVVFKKTAGDHLIVGNGVYSLLGSPMGTIGGGAGSTTLTEFSDANFKVYNNVDPTKILNFDASVIAAGVTRTITMANANVDLADIAANATAIALNTTHRESDGKDHSDVVLNNTHRGLSNNPHSVTKAQVGLTNVSDDAQLKIASNLSDLDNAATARTNLGLGTAAVEDVGTGAGNIPQLDGSGKLVDGIIPDLAISEYQGNFADLATALADAGVQSSERGDWFTVDTGGGSSYIVTTDNPTIAGDVTILKTPTGAVTSVNGDTGVVVLDPDDLDDTATTNKFTTAGDKTKLAGIETLADVTDSVNVGSSIHGASAKTTPVDADTIPLIDSADSNLLKKITWANIKATLLSTLSNTLGYAQATADQASITTVTDVTSCSIAVTVPSGGRRIKITGYIPKVVGTEISGNVWTLSIKESSTVLSIATMHSITGGAVNQAMTALAVLTPSSGSHTYKLTIAASAGTGSIDNDATFPSFILVELI